MPPRLAIVAGGGAAPSRFAEACLRLGRNPYIVALEGQTEPDWLALWPHGWFKLGEAQRLKKTFEEEGVQEVAFMGRVRRPSLSEIRPDALALMKLAKIGLGAAQGDDALLRRIAEAFEEEGYRLVVPQEIFAEWLLPAGLNSAAPVPEELHKDIAYGMQLLSALGPHDIGQAVVIQQGIILGVEAAEGTDALIRRCGPLQREGARAVLVKRRKPQQDPRFDLPTLGPDTLRALAEAGLAGVAGEAGQCLFLDQARARRLADQHGLFVFGAPAE